jgi:two-component system, NarL family, sensor histidine kinase DevS
VAPCLAVTPSDRPAVVIDGLLAVLVRTGRRLVEAQGLLVAVGGVEDMTVGAADGSLDSWWQKSPVTQERPLPEDVPVAVRLTRLPGGGLALAGSPGTTTRAMIRRMPDGRRVLLVADGVAVGRDGDSLGPLLEMVCQLLAAERTAMLGTIRESLHEREQERRRWARELHDDTLQQLGALQVLLRSALQRSANAGTHGGGDLVAAVERATELLSAQTTSLRQLIAELRPATLDELGLGPPLRALAQRTEELSGIPVSLHVSLHYFDGVVETRLLPDVELAIYRVVQEALTNIRRHSTATGAAITVIEEKEVIMAEISDNGLGFDPQRAAGFGLDGMHERAELAGGSLEVVPAQADGSGTTVRLLVPATHRDPA